MRCTDIAVLSCIFAEVAEIAEIAEVHISPRFRYHEALICFTGRHTITLRAGHGLPTWWTFPSPA